MPADRLPTAVAVSHKPTCGRHARGQPVILLSVVALSLVVTSAPARAGVPGGDGPPVVGPYQPPVIAPVIDGFRLPTNPYGPGNRGIDYATEPGTPVGAAGDGTVTFAGPVAGALHVTVLHPDGIRTSYSFLAAVLVSQGQQVIRGQPIGVTGPRLHVGARTGPRQYIDPATLWGQRRHVWLVPLDGVGPQGAPTGAVPAFGAQEAPDPEDLTGADAAVAEGVGRRITEAAAHVHG